jgi:hypothetical protein
MEQNNELPFEEVPLSDNRLLVVDKDDPWEYVIIERDDRTEVSASSGSKVNALG